MKYWRLQRSLRGGGPFISMMSWYVEREDGSYIEIQHRGNPVQEKASISRLTKNPINDVRRELLKEVPKEEVMEALKKALQILDLPQEINILTHKF